MKIDSVVSWVGSVALPEKLQGEGPFEVSAQDLEALFARGDVMLFHAKHKERAAGVQPLPDQVVLALDEPGWRFCQR